MKNFRSLKINKNRKLNNNTDQSIQQPLSFVNKFEETQDFREWNIQINDQKIRIFYLESVVSKEKFYELVFVPLSNLKGEHIEEFLISLNGQETKNEEEIINSLLKGSFAVCLPETQKIYLTSFPKELERTIQEPVNEVVVRGSHDGFIENLQTNIFLIRNRIESPDLTVRYMNIGTKSKTKISLLYLKGIANDEIVSEIERRLSFINSNMIISPGYIEEFIEDNSFSIFPQILNTERPDRVMANLTEGRIILMAEGSPTALIMPATFVTFYQSPDDYNSRWIPATFIRVLRFVSFIIAITLPGIYIAINAFHLEVIPHELVIPLKNSVEGIPYPPLLEAFMMELTIELIREAGIRLPRPIGQTIGIVGGLVIGDAVVNAGLISNIMIVVVALTAVSSFVVPSNEMSTTVRLLRFPLMILASIMGFVGLMFGIIYILIALCRLESFGVPYFAPFAPFRLKELKDAFIRIPLWMMNKRPQSSGAIDLLRQKDSRGWKKHEE